jgi:hypothetical protein
MHDCDSFVYGYDVVCDGNNLRWAMVCALSVAPHCRCVPGNHAPATKDAPLFSRTHPQHGPQQLSSKQPLSSAKK